MIYHWGLDLHLFEDIGCLYLLAICLSFWSKHLLRSFVHFKTSLTVLLLICKSSLYIYDINSSPEINFSNLLLCSREVVFPLLTMLSDGQGLILICRMGPIWLFLLLMTRNNHPVTCLVFSKRLNIDGLSISHLKV